MGLNECHPRMRLPKISEACFWLARNPPRPVVVRQHDFAYGMEVKHVYFREQPNKEEYVEVVWDKCTICHGTNLRGWFCQDCRKWFKRWFK